MMDAVLLVQRSDRFSAHYLSTTRMDFRVAHVWIGVTDYRLNHVAAEISFTNDSIRPVCVEGFHCFSGPRLGARFERVVRQDIKVPVPIHAGDYDAGAI